MLDRRFAQSDIGGGEQNFVQRGADLGSREHGTQAVVRTAAAERHVGIVLARNVEIEGVVEDVFVAIGRAKHRDDAGALLDRRITQHDIAASATNPEDDRRRPAQYFLHGTRADVGIAAIAVGLGGVGDESADAVAQRVARGVTSGQCQDEEEDLQLVRRQQGFSAGLIVDLGRAQRAPDVVDGMLPLLCGQFACVLEQLEERPQGFTLRRRDPDARQLQHLVDEIEHAWPILVRYTHDVPDDRNRQPRSEVNELTSTSIQQRRSHVSGAGADALFELGHGAGGECLGDGSATLGVVGRIEVDDRGIGRKEADFLDQWAVGRGERLVITMHLGHLGVLGAHPELPADTFIDGRGERLVVHGRRAAASLRIRRRGNPSAHRDRSARSSVTSGMVFLIVRRRGEGR